MYRIIHILIALALPIVGMAQTNCIEDSPNEFVFNDSINHLNSCSPTFLSTELTACDLTHIKVTFTGVENPNVLVIDIRRPGANCPMRFASIDHFETGNDVLAQCLCPSSQIMYWDNSSLGDNYLLIDVSGWSDYNLTGMWDVGLSFIGESFTSNYISFDFVGSCCLGLGCTDSSACNYDPTATSDDGSCDLYDECGVCGGDSSCIGCTNAEACNYNADATIDDGSCIISTGLHITFTILTDLLPGETTWSVTDADGATIMSGGPYNTGYTTYTSTACVETGCYDVTINDSYGDGICCDFGTGSYTITSAGNTLVSGGEFTSTETTNFCVTAGNNDTPGCMDSTACNYTPNATIEDGSCVLPDTGYNCDGSCIVDSDGDGVCNLFEILGCTDVLSENYDPIATEDNGSCFIVVNGCTYFDACNYNEIATSDDGSCDFDSCYTVILGCTYPNACNYSASAIEDDGTCYYPTGINSCDCNGNVLDVLGVCGGNCTSDADNDGICDDIDDCVGTVDVCGVCNGVGEPCNGGDVPSFVGIDNPFLEMSYVQNAAPFFSLYNGWFDADFVKIGICNPHAILGQASNSSSVFTISINFEDSPEFVVTVEAPQFQQVLPLQLPSGPNAATASQIVSIRLQDDSGNTLDNLYQDGTPLPNVTLNGINHAPGQHIIIRQPWVLQGNTEVNESEWLVADENQDCFFYSSWNLESTIMVPMNEDSQVCQGDEDGDGICDELEIPMYCQNVNTTNYSPLANTLICDEAEVIEYWISSFNLTEIAQQGGLLPPMDLEQQLVASEMVASSSCASGASQLAFCNWGQRAFVVNENIQAVQIINYGDLTDPLPIPDGSGGFFTISALDIAAEIQSQGSSDSLITSLVPSDVAVFNMDGPDNMVAVAWIDTLNLTSSGWVTFHDTNGNLFSATQAIQQVGPTPRSLAFSLDGEWLVVACSGEGEYVIGDPKAQIVCINVLGYTQNTDAPSWSNVLSYPFNFDDGPHISGGILAITGGASRTSEYDGPNADLSHVLEPSHVAITPDSQRAFVNCQVNNTLVEVNLNNVGDGIAVIHGAYGFGSRDMSSGNGFDGKNNLSATVEQPVESILGWYQPGDMEIAFNGSKTILFTANEGLPSKNAIGGEDVTESGNGAYFDLEIDSEYGLGSGNGSMDSYVYGSRSFSLWDISTPGAFPDLIYDSGSLIEDKLAELMPAYANSLKSTYNSGDQASVSRGPEPAGIALGTLSDKDILIVSLKEMGGSMIFNLLDLDDTFSLSTSYQAYASNRNFSDVTVDVCNNHLGSKDVLFLNSTITSNTSVTGVHEGYESILVSNDETGSLTLYSLDSNFKIPGCMDSCACNYSQYANVDDESCEFTSCVTLGCTYDDAVNYDSAATLDNGTCTFNTTANPCPADLTGDGSVTTADLLVFLSAFGDIC